MSDNGKNGHTGGDAPKKRSAGRPKLDIDPELVERLASEFNPMEDIAHICGCSVDTLENRFSEIFQKRRAQARADLRKKQLDLALGGNITMNIWLGKQYLGQKDSQEITGKDGAPLIPVKKDPYQELAEILNKNSMVLAKNGIHEEAGDGNG